MDFQLINLKKWSYHTASEDMPHETTFFFSFWSWQSTEDKKRWVNKWWQFHFRVKCPFKRGNFGNPNIKGVNDHWAKVTCSIYCLSSAFLDSNLWLMFQTISTFLIQLLGHPERLIISSVSMHPQIVSFLNI